MIEKSNDNDTNAGICPKSDKTQAWIYGGQKIFPTNITMPDNREQIWCGDKGKICTFPFQIKNALTYYSEPFNNKCGTKDVKTIPISYDADELDSAQPCTGKGTSIHYVSCQQFHFSQKHCWLRLPRFSSSQLRKLSQYILTSHSG